MARHLKTRIINGLKSTIAAFVDLPAGTPHSRGVRYFRAHIGVDAYWGAMDTVKEGRKYRKRIIVRPSRFRNGLFELYTYHFPKHWSKACVANRELIKEAQRQAHALEHSYTPEAFEWRLRFFHHYFNVCKGNAKPEPGLKPYTRFYQYAYVAIYRQLQAEAKKSAETSDFTEDYLRHLAEDVTFEPIYPKTRHHFHPYYVHGLRLPLAVSPSTPPSSPPLWGGVGGEVFPPPSPPTVQTSALLR